MVSQLTYNIERHLHGKNSFAEEFRLDTDLKIILLNH